MSPVGKQKVLSVARHLAGGATFSIGAGANLTIYEFFVNMTMDRVTAIVAFIATVLIAVMSKDAEALAPYQPPKTPDGTGPGA